MKKILIILTGLFLLTWGTGFANYFDDHLEQYKMYDISPYHSYVDLKSATIVREQYPYAEIQVDTYTYDTEHKFWMKKVNHYYYDYDSKVILWKLTAIYTCDAYGRTQKGGAIDFLKPTKLNGTGYRAAVYAYEKLYHKTF